MSWRFKVEQDGMEVAGGYAPDEETARREALHYAMMYAGDSEKTQARWFPTKEASQ
jgi:hypothetical protein